MIIAAPVASHASIEPLRAVADEVVYVVAPREFGRVGLWYDDFEEIADADTLAALHAEPAVAPDAEGLPLIQEVRIPVPRGQIAADLLLPANSELRTQNSELSAVVVFAHGSGSNRHSLRNWHVARALLEGGIGVLLLDLLTPVEQSTDRKTAEHRFDIPLLTARVTAAVDWLGTAPETRGLSAGGYGASTGAAAMFAVAAQRPGRRAIVSRGGRVDLAEDALAQVRVPALLVVGSEDPETLAMNQRMRPRFGGPVTLHVIDGADHLFDAPEHLDSLAAAAVSWFGRYLRRP